MKIFTPEAHLLHARVVSAISSLYTVPKEKTHVSRRYRKGEAETILLPRKDLGATLVAELVRASGIVPGCAGVWTRLDCHILRTVALSAIRIPSQAHGADGRHGANVECKPLPFCMVCFCPPAGTVGHISVERLWALPVAAVAIGTQLARVQARNAREKVPWFAATIAGAIDFKILCDIPGLNFEMFAKTLPIYVPSFARLNFADTLRIAAWTFHNSVSTAILSLGLCR